ncbi:MAG: thiamine phosphate synthase [Thermoanaerobaculia bacterium]
MSGLFRVIDANLNRAGEGVRVLEDLARLHFDDAGACAELRDLRHAIRLGAAPLGERLISARESHRDVGMGVSQASRADERSSLVDLWNANFKRVEEATRVIEETLKFAGHYDLAKSYEALRFRAYTAEQQLSRLFRPRRAEAALDTDLYGITAEEHSLGRTNAEVVAEMLAAGVKLVQYREKDKSLADKYRECLEVRRLTRDAGATMIVNDHPDLALMVEADGVHLGQDDAPIAAVRSLVGPSMIIGKSTHSPEQARAAVLEGADYIGVGPLFPTSTKRNVCAAVGLEYLDYAVANVPIPFVAIGGIKARHVSDVRRRGARCLALVTEIVGASDIQSRIGEIRSLLREGSSGAV